MKLAGERLYDALCWYEEQAAGLEPQSNSGPSVPLAAPGLGEQLRMTPPLGVPAQPDAVPNFVDRFRHRFVHTAPTVDEVAEWGRLLRRHRPGDDGDCSSCRGRVFPCHFWANACGALMAAAGLDGDGQAMRLAGRLLVDLDAVPDG